MFHAANRAAAGATLVAPVLLPFTSAAASPDTRVAGWCIAARRQNDTGSMARGMCLDSTSADWARLGQGNCSHMWGTAMEDNR